MENLLSRSNKTVGFSRSAVLPRNASNRIWKNDRSAAIRSAPKRVAPGFKIDERASPADVDATNAKVL